MKTSIWTRIFDLISPRGCAICGRRLSVSESVMCANCHLHLPFTHYESNFTDNPVARLFWGHFPIERAFSLVHFIPQSDVSQMIYDLKYHNQPDIGYHLGIIMAQYAAMYNFFEGIDILIPMPITRARRWQRGYNQCEQLARGISHVTGLPICTDVLRRTHFQGSQTHRKSWERRENVAHAFTLEHAAKIDHKHVLVIDDIITTGATVCACAEQLCQNDSVTVSVLSFGFTKS